MLKAGAQQGPPQRVYTYSDADNGKGLQNDNLFLGGSLALGFGSYQFNIGVSPEIGYSLNSWLDAGLVFNFNYTSIKADPYVDNTQYHIFNYGGGLFARGYPLPYLFLAAQPEYNWISGNAKYMGSGGGEYSYNTGAPSLLLGLGYGQRVIGEGSFYMSLMFDVLGNKNSPYNDSYGHPLPVIKAGFNVYLHKK
jgi:hypothetical protein